LDERHESAGRRLPSVIVVNDLAHLARAASWARLLHCTTSVREPRRILIVDDEEAILFAMRDYFTLRGYEVDTARGVDEAMTRVDTHAYAAVVADLCLSEMPSAEGLDVAGYVRQSRPSTRVILFTAYGSPEIEAEARRRGVLAVLKKPQALTDIERLIRSVAPHSEGQPGSAAS
jgi:DNA-binding NtrC family response regulator